MEPAAVNSAATRNGGVSMPQATPFSSSSQSSRKEWSVLSEKSVRNEELDRSKLGDERLMHELKYGREPLDVDFRSVTTDGGLENDLSQQRLHAVAKQREELQHMEVELWAQLMVRSEIVNMQKTYEAQIKEYATANTNHKEQLHEKEQKIQELERRMEEKERELHAIRLEYEAAWAKEDLIREQNQELQSYRRERNSSEAERIQHITQIHDLQEKIEEKKRQFMELEEQQRIAQETIHFKDEQIREAQSWMTRAQEMDTLQSTTNHTLQAELQERTEQCNQLWFQCRRQFSELERLHSYMQQLQLQLANTKEKNVVHSDGTKTNSSSGSHVENDNDSQLEVNVKVSPSAGPDSTRNGNSENVPSNSSGVNTLTQTDQVHGVAFAPPALLGMATYLHPGQMAAFHPLVMHQQGVTHPSHVTQSHFHSIPPMSSFQHGPSPHVLLDAEHAPTDELHHQQTEQNLLTESRDNYAASLNGQVQHNENVKVHNIAAADHENTQAQPHSLQEISCQLHDALRLDSVKPANETEETKVNTAAEDGLSNKNTVAETATTHTTIFSETAKDASFNASSADALVSSGQKSNLVEMPVNNLLLDERALLACIARAIGSHGRIKISSTLPNRLGKILAPLHWYDYKKKYGKLEEFVASHPDLFLVEEDYVQLREGAQQIIAAAAAAAKVAAAESSYFPPSMAVTPMAQPHRLRKVPSLGSSSVNSDKSSLSEVSVSRPLETISHRSQISAEQNHSRNDEYSHTGGVASGFKILSKSKDHVSLNGHEAKPERTLNVVNGMNSQNIDFSQRMGAFHGKQQNRTMGAPSGMSR